MRLWEKDSKHIEKGKIDTHTHTHKLLCVIGGNVQVVQST